MSHAANALQGNGKESRGAAFPGRRPGAMELPAGVLSPVMALLLAAGARICHFAPPNPDANGYCWGQVVAWLLWLGFAF